MKLVSIIMPSYKRDLSFVKRSLESLLKQTYKNIEIIIVDDSPSSYPNREKIKNYIDNLADPRVRLIQNEKNIGGALARNVGIFASKGDYITFLDDDDMYLEKKIENQVKEMEENDYDLTFSNMLIKNTKGKIIDVRSYHNIWSFEKEEFLKYHIMRHATGTPTFMFKAEKLKAIGGFDDAIMGQEFYLMLKAIENDLKIAYLNLNDVVVFRHNEESISTGLNKIKGENILQEKKEKYFHLLDKKQIRFVNMRHNAVLAVANKRNGKYVEFVYYAIKAFFTDPISCFSEGVNYLQTILKNR